MTKQRRYSGTFRMTSASRFRWSVVKGKSSSSLMSLINSPLKSPMVLRMQEKNLLSPCHLNLSVVSF
jgi:hypothetical protein